MSEITEELLNSIAGSLCITFGTTAPFAIGNVRAEKIGFAQLPCVVVQAYCPHIEPIIPIVRQRVFAELAERGWDAREGLLDFYPRVATQQRERIFVDENESSPSCGRRKRGLDIEVRFEIVDPELKQQTFPIGKGSFSRIPERTA